MRLGVNEFRIGMISSLLVLVAACSGEFPSQSETESEGTQQDALLTDSCAPPPVNLRSAGLFAVLAGSTVTNTGPTDVIGDLGVSPGTAVTGFLPGKVMGTQYRADPTSAQAEADLTVAYNDAAGRMQCPVSLAGNLGWRTLPPGLYKSTSSLEISSGDLTLDAKGDSKAVFIFQVASTLTTTVGRQVILKGGAMASNVFWQVGRLCDPGNVLGLQGDHHGRSGHHRGHRRDAGRQGARADRRSYSRLQCRDPAMRRRNARSTLRSRQAAA